MVGLARVLNLGELTHASRWHVTEETWILTGKGAAIQQLSDGLGQCRMANVFSNLPQYSKEIRGQVKQ